MAGPRASAAVALPAEPLIPAYLNEDAIVFRCPFCRCRIHVHGRSDAAIGTITHRGAHCLPRSPLHGKGITLLIVGEVTATRKLPRWTAEAIAEINRNVVDRKAAAS